MKTVIRYLFVLLVISSSGFAQMDIDREVNVLEYINAGTCTVTAVPDINFNTIDRLFDGNSLTEAGVTGAPTLTVTLDFNTPIPISKSKLFCWNNGTWSLEVAGSLADLNSQTGTYRKFADNRAYSFFAWDSVTFDIYEAKVLRLTANNPADNAIYIGEWTLTSQLRIVDLYISPNPPKTIPNATLKLSASMRDAHGNLYPYTLPEPLIWLTDDQNVATIDDGGAFRGVNVGTTMVTVKTENDLVSGVSLGEVLTDFESELAETKVVKVALVIQDPIINTFNYKRVHEKWGWGNPSTLTTQFEHDIEEASGGVIDFQVVEVYNDQNIFTMIDSVYMTLDEIAYYFQNNQTLYTELKYIAETEGRIKYDYTGMVDFYDFDTKRNNGEIDEVWVYAFPFGGMYESQLMGPGAFWWNSPPLPHPGLNKILSVMGWNYERGVAEAIHSVGHRAESALWHAFGRWDYHAEVLNDWEKFTSFDKETPGKANIGNIHYPPNGTSDYDYTNQNVVRSYADNWKRYPYLLDTYREFNCSEWNCGQLGNMKWWFAHLPKFKGVTNGILNNWWMYFIEYYDAVAMADSLATSIDVGETKTIPEEFRLEQNFPNPFNPTTTIQYALPKAEHITLKIYDVLGREIRTLVDDILPAGTYSALWDGKNNSSTTLASGVYFYTLKAGEYFTSKKMALVK